MASEVNLMDSDSDPMTQTQYDSDSHDSHSDSHDNDSDSHDNDTIETFLENN